MSSVYAYFNVVQPLPCQLCQCVNHRLSTAQCHYVVAIPTLLAIPTCYPGVFLPMSLPVIRVAQNSMAIRTLTTPLRCTLFVPHSLNAPVQIHRFCTIDCQKSFGLVVRYNRAHCFQRCLGGGGWHRLVVRLVLLLVEISYSTSNKPSPIGLCSNGAGSLE